MFRCTPYVLFFTFGAGYEVDHVGGGAREGVSDLVDRGVTRVVRFESGRTEQVHTACRTSGVLAGNYGGWFML